MCSTIVLTGLPPGKVAVSIYVRPFSLTPGAGVAGARYLVAASVSSFPRWRTDGMQLFYATGNLDLMAVGVNTKAGFQAGPAQRLFTAPPPLMPVAWSVAPAGDRFLFITTPDGGKPAPYRVVVNWPH